jgi:uncharacterized protein YjbI with pentapeptide repeats
VLTATGEFLVRSLFSKFTVSKGMIAGLFLGGVLGSVGVAAAIAPQSATSKTYYACLANGNLTKVSLVAGTCPSGQLISWNSQGLQGPKGDTGPAGPQAATVSNFTGQNFSGAWLAHGSFIGALFINTNLQNANLSEATLIGANLSGADLRSANLTGANLTGAILTGPWAQSCITCVLNSANFSDVNFAGAVINLTIIPTAKVVNFARANFTGATLNGLGQNAGADLTGATCPNGIIYGRNGANC